MYLILCLQWMFPLTHSPQSKVSLLNEFVVPNEFPRPLLAFSRSCCPNWFSWLDRCLCKFTEKYYCLDFFLVQFGSTLENSQLVDCWKALNQS